MISSTMADKYHNLSLVMEHKPVLVDEWAQRTKRHRLIIAHTRLNQHASQDDIKTRPLQMVPLHL
jgi:hypothetical protein